MVLDDVALVSGEAHDEVRRRAQPDREAVEVLLDVLGQRAPGGDEVKGV